MTQRAHEIYTKLFRALGEGGAKEEKVLSARLRQRFMVPPKVRLSKYLSENVEPEAVFVEIATELEPFSLMLQEIYGFLYRNRSTVKGKADQFSMRFEAINDRVPFGLDSFPKTYLQALQRKQIEDAMLTPDARGHDLLVTMPFTLAEEHALHNLGRHPLLWDLTYLLDAAPGHPDARGFIGRHWSELQRLAEHVERALALCRKVFTYRREGEGRFDGHMYFRDQEAIDRWGRRAESREKTETLFQENRIIDLAVLHYFKEAWIQFHNRPPGTTWSGVRIPTIPDEDLFARQVAAFYRAYDLAIQCETQVEEQLDRIIDHVILPFWRHRWRLYEVWALVKMMNCLPDGYVSSPRLTPFGETSEWVMPHGKAREPIGIIQGDGKELEIWFQRETPISGGHIEPDVRIMTSDGRDIVILELKDRHECATWPLTKCGENYALNTGAPQVILANYSRFDSQRLSGRTDTLGPSTVRYRDLFKPGSIPEEVMTAVRDAIKHELWRYNLLVDISVSTDGIDIRGCIEQYSKIIGKGPSRVITFSIDILAESADLSLLDFTPQGGTDLVKVLQEYSRSDWRDEVSITVILTDADGKRDYGRVPPEYSVNTACILYTGLSD